MSATTQNFAVTQNTAKNEVFTMASISSDDQFIFLIESEGTRVSKRNLAAGGSDDEISTTLGTGGEATVKLTAKDTKSLAVGSVTYKLYAWNNNLKYWELIFQGTITVSAESGSSEFQLNFLSFDIARANCSLASLTSFANTMTFPSPVILTEDEKVVLQKADKTLEKIGSDYITVLLACETPENTQASFYKTIIGNEQLTTFLKPDVTIKKVLLSGIEFTSLKTLSNIIITDDIWNNEVFQDDEEFIFVINRGDSEYGVDGLYLVSNNGYKILLYELDIIDYNYYTLFVTFEPIE